MKPVRKKTLPVLVAEEIKENIVSRRFQPHERLPGEVELSRSLGVGRPTVREALRILEGQGWVHIKFNLGAYVADREMMIANTAALAKKPRLIELLEIEFPQLEREGAEIPDSARDEFERLKIDGTPRELAVFYGSLEELPPRAGYPFSEPSDLMAILSHPPLRSDHSLPPDDNDGNAADQIHGAWLGSCIGAIMGRPFDGWSHKDLGAYLAGVKRYPLRGYIPEIAGPLEQRGGTGYTHDWGNARVVEGSIAGVPRDYHLDFAVLDLVLVQHYGLDFSSTDVADLWQAHLPFKRTWSAERTAYQNYVMEWLPPATARKYNPYREWWGAMGRSHTFGLLDYRRSRHAAEMAYRDACFSHTGNGIYSAMFVAAATATAVTERNVREAIDGGAAVIPEESRLGRLAAELIEASDSGADWEQLMETVGARCGTYSRYHVLPNMGRLLAALLAGDGSFAKTVGLATMGGCMTNANATVAGAIMGAIAGTANLPAELVAPLEDRLDSGISGFHSVQISKLARWTVELGNGDRNPAGWPPYGS